MKVSEDSARLSAKCQVFTMLSVEMVCEHCDLHSDDSCCDIPLVVDSCRNATHSLSPRQQIAALTTATVVLSIMILLGLTAWTVSRWKWLRSWVLNQQIKRLEKKSKKSASSTGPVEKPNIEKGKILKRKSSPPNLQIQNKQVRSSLVPCAPGDVESSKAKQPRQQRQQQQQQQQPQYPQTKPDLQPAQGNEEDISLDTKPQTTSTEDTNTSRKRPALRRMIPRSNPNFSINRPLSQLLSSRRSTPNLGNSSTQLQNNNVKTNNNNNANAQQQQMNHSPPKNESKLKNSSLLPIPKASDDSKMDCTQFQARQIFRIIYPHYPRNPDELVANTGESVQVLRMYRDGWVLATHRISGLTGFIPSTCLDMPLADPYFTPPHLDENNQLIGNSSSSEDFDSIHDVD
ncbi:hypothetical protein H4219_002011 [Mycoemilia scoparia]|uniref:SH3 domain-containing protein n=1 Tax=Mycoemilia scoparia TaxID=417184 RepID=A0A9W8DPP9_9FUNG|nr:hypothetical protein H4219_002011 [Mycoemilia scoparia]